MPGKSRHGKGRQFHSKKGKALQRKAAGTAPAVSVNASAASPQPVPAAVATPQPKVAAAPTRAALNPYPYITSELRRIAILAGVIIVILVVLYVVLS
ncbi:MAG: hypothetical protein A2Y92_04820 [Chloroflexi bacterium RBG_13_57_8]|nr:MAG: hypothetical protein A2Y92_04820 [Chloroflexi bacterium RBG_13_57_8]